MDENPIEASSNLIRPVGLGLEKAGVPLMRVHKWLPPAVRCSEDISRWYLIEHAEQRQLGEFVSFPGEVAMLSGRC